MSRYVPADLWDIAHNIAVDHCKKGSFWESELKLTIRFLKMRTAILSALIEERERRSVENNIIGDKSP